VLVGGALRDHEQSQGLLLAALAGAFAAGLGGALLQLLLELLELLLRGHHLLMGLVHLGFELLYLLLGGVLLPLHSVERGGHLGVVGGPGGSTGAKTLYLGAKFAVLIAEAGEFSLHLVEETVDLVLVVSALSEHGFLERDVVNVCWGQRHSKLLLSYLPGGQGHSTP